jgi:8-oxo-dGTP pyrophosphatase MutT (NUDIX family)
MSQKPDWLRPHGAPWKKGAARTAFENAWIRVSEVEAIAPTGEPALYGLVSFKNRAIAVLPLHDDGTVTLVGQNRFPAGDYSWEVPEGGVPFDEDLLDGAKRELLEETGLVAREWREVMRVQLSNSVTDEVAAGYLALGLSAAKSPGGDETEDIETARVPFAEALDAALAGWLPDMLTVAMLLRTYHMAREGVLPDGLARLMLRDPPEKSGVARAS